MSGSRLQLTPILWFYCWGSEKNNTLLLKQAEDVVAPSACLCIYVYVISKKIHQLSGEMNRFVWQRGHKKCQDSQHLKTKRQSAVQCIGIQPCSSVIVHFPATIHVMSCFSNPGVPFLHKVIEKHNTIIWDRRMGWNKALSKSSENARRILKVRVKVLSGLWFINL